MVLIVVNRRSPRGEGERGRTEGDDEGWIRKITGTGRVTAGDRRDVEKSDVRRTSDGETAGTACGGDWALLMVSGCCGVIGMRRSEKVTGRK